MFPDRPSGLGAVHVAAQQGDVAKLRQLSGDQLREAGDKSAGDVGLFGLNHWKWSFMHDFIMKNWDWTIKKWSFSH